jgi:hypothetical protein
VEDSDGGGFWVVKWSIRILTTVVKVGESNSSLFSHLSSEEIFALLNLLGWFTNP